MKRIVFVLISLLSPLFLFSQNWQELNKLVNEYYEAGKTDSSFKYAQKALIQAEKEFGKKDTVYAISLTDLAILYAEMNNYEKAEQLYIEAIQVRKTIHGEGHPDYANSMNDLGIFYYLLGKYDKTEPIFIEASKIYKTNGHPDYAASLNNLAMLYQEIGQYEKAIPYYEECIKIDKELLGENHPDYATDLDNFGSLYANIGQYEKAEPLYLEALRIRRTVLGPKHPDYAISLNNVALFYHSKGNYDKAIPLFLETRQIIKETLGIKHMNYATILDNLANIYQTKGEYNKAEPLFTESLEIRKVILGVKHPDYAISLNNLARLYEEIGRYKEAKPLYIESKQIIKNVLGVNHANYVTAIQNLALLHQKAGNFKDAEPLFLEAYKKYREIYGEKHPDYAGAANTLAGFYRVVGNYERAEPLYVEALNLRKEILGTKHPEYAASLNNLAILYAGMDNYEKAESLYVEAIEIYKEVLGENHPDYANSLNNLALLYSKTDKHKKAESVYLEAIKIQKNVLGEEHPGYANSLNNLAYLFDKIGHYEKAEQLFKKSANINKKVLNQNHPYYTNPLYNLGVLYTRTGAYEKAEPFYIEANKILNQRITQLFSFMSEKEKSALMKIQNYNLDLFNSFCLKYKSNNRAITEHSYNNALTYKGTLLRSSRRVRENILKSTDSSLINTYNEWVSVKLKLSNLNSGSRSDTEVEIVSLEEKANQLEKDLTRKSQEFNDIQKDKKIIWQDVRANLKTDEAAIEFIHFDYFNKDWTDSTLYCALILRADYENPEMVYLFEEKELEKIVKRPENASDINFIKQLYAWDKKKQTATSDTKYKGKSLYNLIWNPLDSLLRGIKTIYLAPSGFLHKISFAAIPYSDTNILSDKYQINYVSSTREIKLKKKTYNFIEKENYARIYGGISYDFDSVKIAELTKSYKETENEIFESNYSFADNWNLRGGSWLYLHGTLSEARKISRLFEEINIKTQFFSEQEATEETFKNLSEHQSPIVIHFATHGFFFPDVDKRQKSNYNLRTTESKVFEYSDNPLFHSGLVMAGANHAWKGEKLIAGIEDGILTAYEVSNTNLSNTQLVVMSACETGLGEIKGSEGVYGLQRAFKMAGVDRIIMSLWQIPDYQTVQLMEQFYSNWLGGKNIREAFNFAQKEMRKEYDVYYWAAFVLID